MGQTPRGFAGGAAATWPTLCVMCPVEALRRVHARSVAALARIPLAECIWDSSRTASVLPNFLACSASLYAILWSRPIHRPRSARTSSHRRVVRRARRRGCKRTNSHLHKLKTENYEHTKNSLACSRLALLLVHLAPVRREQELCYHEDSPLYEKDNDGHTPPLEEDRAVPHLALVLGGNHKAQEDGARLQRPPLGGILHLPKGGEGRRWGWKGC